MRVPVGLGAGTPPGTRSPWAQGWRTSGIFLHTTKVRKQACTRTLSLDSRPVPVAVGRSGAPLGHGETRLSFLSSWGTLPGSPCV